jgi:6-oxo-cyclohex-1-ene-carbonyl-CoA hydrolase
MKSIAGIRQKKKYFWDLNKNDHLFWLGVNMSSEAFLGFGAFNTKKITGKDTIDFVKYRQLLAEGALVDDELFEAVLGTPQEK